MTPTLVYFYDAYCGWCFGFSEVMRKLYHHHQEQYLFDVYSGGMILPEEPRHISVTADYIKESYKRVEELANVKFGSDYLWHIFNPAQSDWYPDSLKPAIALGIFREYFPDLQVPFAGDLQNALFVEGRDLCDKEAYRHLVEKYNLPETEFFEKLKSPEYEEKAKYDFALVKQLKVTGFPTLFLQVSDSKFYLLAQGFTDYQTVTDRLASIVSSLENK